MSNPLLEPIHGISLYDYAASSAKIAAGVQKKDIYNALGIEPAVFEEASALWITRMQQDSSREVTTLFGQYFGQVDQHPGLKNLKAMTSEVGNANMEKLKADRYFYEALCGARQAAYQYGLDGAQWIQDNFGINLGDFQSVAMQWMNAQNEEMSKGNYNYVTQFAEYQQQKQKEYAAKFAVAQGGDIADDIEF